MSWDTAWHNLTGKAGLAGLRFHDLRHSFITHMVSGATRQAVDRLEPILTGIPPVAVVPQIPQTTRVQ